MLSSTAIKNLDEQYMKDNLVRIVTDVSEECKVELKVLALRKRTTLPILVREILERTVSKKVKEQAESELKVQD